MITQRTFWKYTGGTAQIPGGTLDPNLIPKFQTPLLIPPVMSKAGRIVVLGGKTRRHVNSTVMRPGGGHLGIELEVV